MGDLQTLAFKIKNKNALNNLTKLNYYKQKDLILLLDHAFNYEKNISQLFDASQLAIVYDSYLGMYNISSTTLYRDYCDLEKISDNSIDHLFKNEYQLEEDWDENRLAYQAELLENSVLDIN
ncbi:hypothetical protein P344_03600 [Spiroplasma mirum ATCC 29335]|uniref:Uncharacterized protein n=1 Tax=Spiroplasma mirum ATCC 29335 TaxID=838561 RepID=W0GL96_9MOLU|nr:MULTISPECIES: hypothetical protein [Spiroplasma]AHF61030.1 truncated helicase [Spiroplasma mirum ATCC 29335]AHI58061.1 hypothetical protein P344_03600 [Spiroplasma mirum ATCC 29335]